MCKTCFVRCVTSSIFTTENKVKLIIWSNEVQFNNQAEWIPNLENEIPDSNNPHHIQISLEI
jgi:hypothetical protein